MTNHLATMNRMTNHLATTLSIIPSSNWHSQVLNQKVIYSTHSWEPTISGPMIDSLETVVSKRKKIPSYKQLRRKTAYSNQSNNTNKNISGNTNSEKSKIKQYCDKWLVGLDWWSGDTSIERRCTHWSLNDKKDWSCRKIYQTKRTASTESMARTRFMFSKKNNQNYQFILGKKEEENEWKQQNHFKPMYNSLGLHKQTIASTPAPFAWRLLIYYKEQQSLLKGNVLLHLCK